MNDAPSIRQGVTNKATIWLLVAAGLLLVAGANAHLVYVAVTSQPACVAHLRPGEAAAPHGGLTAATSACSPQRQDRRQDPE